jgi:hypothetical protein
MKLFVVFLLSYLIVIIIQHPSCYCGNTFPIKSSTVPITKELIHQIKFHCNHVNDTSYKVTIFFYRFGFDLFTELTVKNKTMVPLKDLNFERAFNHTFMGFVFDDIDKMLHKNPTFTNLDVLTKQKLFEDINQIIISFILTKHDILEIFKDNGDKYILNNIAITHDLLNKNKGPQYLARIAQIFPTTDLITLLHNYNDPNKLNFLTKQTYSNEFFSILREIEQNQELAGILSNSVDDYVNVYTTTKNILSRNISGSRGITNIINNYSLNTFSLLPKTLNKQIIMGGD